MAEPIEPQASPPAVPYDDRPALAADAACCVVLNATASAPQVFGTLSLTVVSSSWDDLLTVAGALPPPSSFRSDFTRYVAWIYGGASLRFAIPLLPAVSGIRGTYAGGLVHVPSGPLSEIAISPEPPFSGNLTGPPVLLGSFAFCR